MSAPKEEKTLFYVPTDRRKEFTALSNVEYWYGHWDPGINRTRRCGNQICAMCAMGYSRKLSMVCLVRDESNKEYWLELRERHRAVIDQGEEGKGKFAGSRLVVKKEGNAKNSPVFIGFLGKEFVERREIVNFVEKLGSEPLLIQKGSTSTSERHA